MSVDAPGPDSKRSGSEQLRAEQSRAQQSGREQYGHEQPIAKMSLGVPRTARLLKHSDFERVYKQGRRHFSPHMTVFYLTNSVGQTRVGFTVGRALGGAVERNRIKRRLREAARLRRSTIQQPLDIVINPKKSVLTLQFVVILEEIGRAFNTIDSAAGKKAAGTPKAAVPKSGPPRSGASAGSAAESPKQK